MGSNKSVFGGTRFLRVIAALIIAALSCLAVLGLTALSSRKQETSFEERLRQKKERLRGVDLRLQNLTRGLTVVKIEKHVDQDVVQVVLRNDYEKIITAYKVAVGSGSTATEIIPEQDSDDLSQFRPGDTREEMYPLQDDVDTLGIKILAVVFDDKTSDGVPRYVQEIQDYRLGMKMGIKRALELLNVISQLPESGMPQAVEQAQRKLLGSSTDGEKPLSHFVKAGLHDVQGRISRDLAMGAFQKGHSKDSKISGLELTGLVNRLARALGKL